MNTSTSAPAALLPPAKVLAALDGGLGYTDLIDRDSYTFVVVGPLMNATSNDGLTVFWDGTIVEQRAITQADLDAGAFTVAVNNGRIADLGDGDKVISYTVDYTMGGGRDESTPITVKVKRSVPGGLDPDPTTPPVNDNLVPITVVPHPVPPDAAAVTLVIPTTWKNAAVGDVVTVSWSGARFYAAGLATPLPPVVTVTLTAAQVLDAGVGPAVPVTWGIHDVVNNWSGWAPLFNAEVNIEDPGALIRPRVGDKETSWTVLDLVQIGSNSVPVFTPVYQGYAADDKVTVHWRGSNGSGDEVDYDSEPQPMTDDGYGLRFDIPNGKVVALAGGNLRVTYSVQPFAGGAVRPSKTAYLTVTDAGGVMPAPMVPAAVDGVLDPSSDAQVTIPTYPAIAAFDTVALICDGVNGNGAPIYHDYEKQVDATGTPPLFTVNKADLLTFLDGKAEFYYRVTPFTRRAEPLPRALTTRESLRLPLKIRRTGAELPFPAPSVDNLVGGVLDPSTQEAVIRVTGNPPYPGIASGDEVTYTWFGAVSTFTTTVKVGATLTVPPAYVERKYIADNIGGNVVASYSVLRVGTVDPIPSSTTTFRINANPTFIAPVVPEAPGGTLPGDAPAATLRVLASSGLQRDDSVTAYFAGSNLGTKTATAGGSLDFNVGAALITANQGKSAICYYTVLRRGTTWTSADLSLNVSAVTPTFPAPVVPEAPGGTLPGNSPRATFRVLASAGLRSGDRVTAYVGSTSLGWQEATPGKPLDFPISEAVIVANQGNLVTCYYTVLRDGSTWSSEPLPMTVTTPPNEWDLEYDFETAALVEVPVKGQIKLANVMDIHFYEANLHADVNRIGIEDITFAPLPGFFQHRLLRIGHPGDVSHQNTVVVEFYKTWKTVRFGVTSVDLEATFGFEDTDELVFQTIKVPAGNPTKGYEVICTAPAGKRIKYVKVEAKDVIRLDFFKFRD